MFKKSLLITALFILMTLPALCDSINLRISVTVPRLPGLNYFPNEADVVPTADDAALETMAFQEKAIRDGKAVLLKTSMVK